MKLLEGAYDLHVHSAPDVLPRLMDDIEMGQRITDAGMGGYAIKSHYFCTAERAEIIRKLYPACDAVGTITLNSAVGGINPTAVEMAGRAGAKLVWFPTCDNPSERKHVFNGDPNKKLPYWAQILIEMQKEGISAPMVQVLDEQGTLTEETNQVLDVLAKHNMILATSHLSHEECFPLVKEAHKRGVKNIIITHVDFPTTFYTIEEQLELAKYGAVMEHCYTTWATGKIDIATSIEQIKALGPERVIIATDLGQKTSIYPDEGMASYAQKLLAAGISEEDVRQMCVYNQKKLLGK
ncbi:MAG: DUF6282 family protein [Candidatus Cloacimonetes bacterium]|jgi:hypothetical protein|uniref:DUF6282 family protein n=1 Tax=Sphaerochaeta associata TaxID=1129264 RepID=UPI000AF33DF1|nr:DUF6282 family protein [Sphaerochaeta associata]MDD3523625.1 DUF6282 family protein [Candidatus Cloacimonadota bacterium]MEA5028959.1 DUF6282 family protein [Sphaerochaeta associata]